MIAALRLWWNLRQHESSSGRRLTALAVGAFAVATTALLVTAGGVHAFVERAAGAPPDDLRHVYVFLAATAAALLVVPVTTLGAVAARLALSRRDARLASLRLAGATSAQVSAMTLAESAAQALTGALAGAVGYGLCLFPLTGLVFQGYHLGLGELWLGVPLLALAVAAVVLLAVASGLMSLARVVVSPLGVAARTSPAKLHVIRLVIAGAALLVWVVGFRNLAGQGVGVLIAALVVVVATVNVVGPWLVMVAGMLVARRAKHAETLLAARRIIDDPRATWRMVSALALGILVAALSGISSAIEPDPHMPRDEQLLGVDVGTGALVALAIIAVVAATSTGVVQAARVLDQRPAYRALALAGAPLSFLHGARLREVAIPLVVTVVVGGTFPALLLLPLSLSGNVTAFPRAVLAIAAACLLVVASVTASRGLVREAATV